MTAADRGPHDRDSHLAEDVDGLAEVDEELSPKVRRFLQSIAGPAGEVRTARARRRIDAESRVTRFAWACEEAALAFAMIDPTDPETRALLIDHGLVSTLDDLQAKADALLGALGSTTTP